MITDEEYRKIVSKLKIGTPETRIIVDKWNNRVFKKYKFELFEYFEDMITKELEESIEKGLFIDHLPPYPLPKMTIIPSLNSNVVFTIGEEDKDA